MTTAPRMNTPTSNSDSGAMAGALALSADGQPIMRLDKDEASADSRTMKRGDTESRVRVQIPPCWSTEVKVDKNRARQLLVAPGVGEVVERGGRTFAVLSSGERVPIVSGPASVLPGERALKAGRDSLREPARLAEEELKWIGDRSPTTPTAARESLAGEFYFKREEPGTAQSGLRVPQIGAVHAVLGYWTTSPSQPGTIVMPTGTGKTETMVALFAAAQTERLLVVVPSDALRTQIAEKFETLGVLQENGVIGLGATRPIVGQLSKKLQSADSVRQFAASCNVVVATPSALFASAPDVHQAFLGHFSHLFVDEAHHVEAATWRRIRDEFANKSVLQFTATPYREDGRHLVGRIVYTFPLREAQEQGYFSTIDYLSVVDFENPDLAIATEAVERLRSDLAQDLDHVLMARVRRIGRAREICELYESIAPDLAPVVLYSKLPAKDRREALAALRARSSRAIVCVDMLGEGFDLPALKVAAIHDPHKSLGVTLQFVGRFARVADETIGNATVVVGRPDLDDDNNLRQLYAEDADWNHIVRNLSEGAVGEQEDISEFEAAFGELPEEVSLRNLEPKMSTVVFRTATTSWKPHAVLKLFDEEQLLTLPIAVNEQEKVTWFVTETHSPIRWGDLRSVEEVTFDLYVLYWDVEQQLLYINSSNNGSTHDGLAKAVCGQNAQRIAGEEVYRVMANINRLVPTNVGLLDMYKRSRRFSMHVGADVTEGFPTAEAQTKTKTNIFAHGFESGSKVSIGASQKGRIWSYRVAPTLKHWMRWCDHVGTKLIDDGIDLDDVMKGFVRPERVESRPELVPIAIEWSWQSLFNAGQGTEIAFGNESVPLVDADLEISRFDQIGPIGFRVCGTTFSADYELAIVDGAFAISAQAGEAEVVTSRSRIPLSEYLDKFPPLILFEQEAMLMPPGIMLRPNREVASFDADKLTVVDWNETDIRKEVQGPDRDPDSIQALAIRHILNRADWDIVIDDHGTGEVADVVALRVEEDQLVMALVHCKKAGGDPGSRVDDLYELLGQAQKATRWRRNPGQTIRRLITRERQRVQRGERSGFETGDGQALYNLRENARLLRPVFEMTVVQPGLAKSRVSATQLELLGAAETYIHETTSGSFEVICSA